MIINEISVLLQGRAGEKGEPGLTVCTILIITLEKKISTKTHSSDSYSGSYTPLYIVLYRGKKS